MEYLIFFAVAAVLAYSLMRLAYAKWKIRQIRRETELVLEELKGNADRYPTLEEFFTFVNPERLDEE